MTERLQGQRTADEVTMRVNATVHNVDEALTWIVRQMDRLKLDQPQAGFAPLIAYSADSDEPEDFYEVWITGMSRST